jgi:hypothetical protein
MEEEKRGGGFAFLRLGSQAVSVLGDMVARWKKTMLRNTSRNVRVWKFGDGIMVAFVSCVGIPCKEA